VRVCWGYRHSGTWCPGGRTGVGRASKKALSFYSTSAACLVISSLTFIAGLLCQLIHTMSPLSSIPTGYLFAVKYTKDLFALSWGVMCRWALTFVWHCLIAISRALRATGDVASSIKRGSGMAGVTLLNVLRSTGSYWEPSSPISYARQLSLLLFHPLRLFGNCTLLRYIQRDLSTTPVW
jgi:hypothetical protein